MQFVYDTIDSGYFVISEARIIGVMRLANKKEKWEIGCINYWLRLVQTQDQLIDRLLSNACRGPNRSEPVCLDPFCALIG